MTVLFLGLYATALAMNHEWRSAGRMLLWMSPACVVTALYARARIV